MTKNKQKEFVMYIEVGGVEEPRSFWEYSGKRDPAKCIPAINPCFCLLFAYYSRGVVEIQRVEWQKIENK